MTPPAADADLLLGDLLAALSRDEPLQPQCRRWLRDGLAALARGEASSLDAALGLRRHSGQSARLSRRLRMAARDAHLTEALAAVALSSDVTTWERCRRLASEVSAFNRTAYTLRLLQSPRPEWSTVRRCLWAAALLNLPLPENAIALHRAIARSGGFSRNADAGRVPAYASTINYRPD